MSTSQKPLHDRDGVLWLDGALVPWREAKLHVLTHGLHYASSVFEGERAYGGRIFKLQAHTARLVRSAAILGFDLPFSEEQLIRATRDVVRANAIVDGYVRPVAWLGSEELGVYAPNSTVHVAIAAWSFNPFAGGAKERGIRLARCARWRRPSPQCAPTEAKAAGNYMIGTMSRAEAERKGFDDALLLDHRGFVAEASGANIFIVKNGVITTPIPDGFLDGITRQVVIAEARSMGFTVIEKHVTDVELADADEVFLTGTAYEVQPIRAIDDRTYAIGEVTQTLARRYEALVRSRRSPRHTKAAPTPQQRMACG